MLVIEAKGLAKTYCSGGVETHALKEATFNVEPGEFISIMGPSGSGKSTLLHLIGFLDSYTKGEYFFDGRNAKEYSAKEIADIRNKIMGFVFQAFNLLARTSAVDNIKLPLLY